MVDVCGTLSSSVPFGIIPQENSIFGTVVETYDILRNTGTNFVRGEIVLRIDHCLIVKKGVKLNQIRKVMSHEQVNDSLSPRVTLLISILGSWPV